MQKEEGLDSKLTLQDEIEEIEKIQEEELNKAVEEQSQDTSNSAEQMQDPIAEDLPPSEELEDEVIGDGKKHKKKKHKKDARAVSKKANIIITSCVCAIALASGIGLGVYFGAPLAQKQISYDNVKEVDSAALFKKFTDSGNDITKFKDHELVNIAYYGFEQTPVHYTKVSDGWALAMGQNQLIRSVYGRVNDNYFGEALSTGILKIGKRWYQKAGENVEHYNAQSIDANAEAVTNVTWEKETCATYTESEMKETWGKPLQNANIYVISEATVKESNRLVTDDQIIIELSLKPDKAVKNYVRQMKIMSDLSRNPVFSSIDMTLKFTKDLKIIDRHVHETYSVYKFGMNVNTDSEMTENYYVEEFNIPDINTFIEY